MNEPPSRTLSLTFPMTQRRLYQNTSSDFRSLPPADAPLFGRNIRQGLCQGCHFATAGKITGNQNHLLSSNNNDSQLSIDPECSAPYRPPENPPFPPHPFSSASHPTFHNVLHLYQRTALPFPARKCLRIRKRTRTGRLFCLSPPPTGMPGALAIFQGGKRSEQGRERHDKTVFGQSLTKSTIMSTKAAASMFKIHAKYAQLPGNHDWALL